MDWSDLQAALDVELFTVAGTTVTGSSVAIGVAILLIGLVLTRAADRGLGRVLLKRGADHGSISATLRLARYSLLALTLGVALSAVGIDLSALFAAGAIFAVGLGFAMQTLAQNFVSGVILLVERSIKPGDVLKVDGQMVRVEEIRIRSTIVRAIDDEELIIPNSTLVQSTVTNYAFSDPLLRVRCSVGVSYSSDMKRVRAVLEEAAAAFKDRLASPAPFVAMREFGDSAVVWEFSIWSDRPWDVRTIRGRLLESVWFALQDAGITIAFPQLDVHLAGAAVQMGGESSPVAMPEAAV